MKLHFALLFLLSSALSYGYQLRGSVRNAEGEPIIGASVYVKNSTYGVLTNANGEYFIELQQGTYTLVFRSIGYLSKEMTVTMGTTAQELDVVLENDITQLQEVTISDNERELGKSIMQKAIEKRKFYFNQLPHFVCTTYVKASLEKEPLLDKKKDSTSADSAKNQRLNLIESLSKSFYSAPNTWHDQSFAYLNHTEKPEVPNVDIDLSAYGLYTEQSSDYAPRGYNKMHYHLYYRYNAEGDYNLYQNLLHNPKISDQAITSPLSSTATLNYIFKHVEAFYEGEQYIHKIAVEPRNKRGPAFRGFVFIVDSSWALKAAELSLHPSQLMAYQKFSFIMNRDTLPSGEWVTKRLAFYYEARDEEDLSLLLGQTEVIRHSFQTKQEAGKEWKSMPEWELLPGAAEQGQEYWADQRPVSLKKQEQTFIIRQDSVREYMKSPEYINMRDSSYNHTNLPNILFTGVGYRNTSKGHTFFIIPVIMQLRPFNVGGYRHALGGSYTKILENYKRLDISGSLDYGFNTNDLKGRMEIRYKYNPKTFSSIVVGGGSEYAWLNPYEGFIGNLSPSNMILYDHLKLGAAREIVNGLFVESSINYSQQRDISHIPIAPWLQETMEGMDSFYYTNSSTKIEPIPFDDYTKLELDTRIEIRFRQQYISEPNRKYIIGSDMPKLNIRWRMGIPNVLGSDVRYQYLQATVFDDFLLGKIGFSRYSISLGSFFGNTDIRIADEKYFIGSDPWWFSNPMRAYQFLGPNLSTTQPFVEAHYLHRFNGLFFNKLPLIKHLGLQTMAGSSALLEASNQVAHIETYAGLEKPFRFLGVYMRFGVYYIVGVGTLADQDTMWKVGLDAFNPITARWTY